MISWVLHNYVKHPTGLPCPKVVSRERSRRQKGDKCLYKDRANPTGKETEGASYTDSILEGDTVRYQNIS